MPDGRITPIQPDDVPAVVGLVYELAEYERLRAECHLTEQQLRDALFAPSPALFGFVARHGGGSSPDVSGGDESPAGKDRGDRSRPDAVVGYALYFLNFSTWEGVHGIYLEDLFVRPEARGAGLGKALLTALAEQAVQRGLARVEWSVLDWNTPSIDFYRAIGAVPMDGWSTFRLTGPALRTAAGTG